MHTIELTVIDTTTHPDFFARLGLGDATPEQLWVRGNLDALTTTRLTVTLTGSRAATSYGDHITTEFAADLGRTHRIVTGGAYGIEGAATRAALAAGASPVIITAAGIDRPYPAGHRDLFDAVAAAGGAIVTETAPGLPPTRQRFADRQRILAALSHAVVIVEAGSRSGSLRVADWAHTLGRPTAGVPGPLTSAASTGVHQLIRRGRATLVTSADEIRDIADPWAPLP